MIRRCSPFPSGQCWSAPGPPAWWTSSCPVASSADRTCPGPGANAGTLVGIPAAWPRWFREPGRTAECPASTGGLPARTTRPCRRTELTWRLNWILGERLRETRPILFTMNWLTHVFIFYINAHVFYLHWRTSFSFTHTIRLFDSYWSMHFY